MSDYHSTTRTRTGLMRCRGGCFLGGHTPFGQHASVKRNNCCSFRVSSLAQCCRRVIDTRRFVGGSCQALGTCVSRNVPMLVGIERHNSSRKLVRPNDRHR